MDQETDLQRLRSKFRGALLGVAIGDALGAPYEGIGPIGTVNVERLLQRQGILRYTDDTHMTLGIAESLVGCGAFDGNHMASVCAHNYFGEPWRGYGAGPPGVFRRIVDGVPWDQAALDLFGGSGSYGNGAAMRVAPVALLAYQDLSRVRELARGTSIITHTHELGIEGAILQACALALLLQQPATERLEPHSFLDALRRQTTSIVYCQKIDHVDGLLSGQASAGPVRLLGNGVAAFEAVPAALYAFLRASESFADVVVTAINLGGDTDTIASMAAALAGAYLGEAHIPTAWRNTVEGGARLRELADSILTLATPGAS